MVSKKMRAAHAADACLDAVPVLFIAGRPACLNVSTDPDVVHPTMPAMVGADTQGENEIMIPYYDNIQL